MKQIRTSLLLIFIGLILLPQSSFSQRKMENLGRGTVAVRKNNSSVFISWRIFSNEFDNGTVYNLYRDNTLIASNLSVSNYTDNVSGNGNYQVAAVNNGIEETLSPEVSVYSQQIIHVPLENIGDYYVHLAWVGDLNGDGEYEIVADRIPNSADSTCKVEAYELDGTRLWQIDMGPLSIDRDGIEGGSAAISNGMNDGVTVYDMDCDGKAEVLLKTAKGTVFPDGTVVNHSDNIGNFLSVLNGMTGNEKARIQLPTDYQSDGPLQTQFNIGYLDGMMPSAIISCKNRIGSGDFNKVIAAYDYRAGHLSLRWKWLRGNKVGSGQKDFHQQRIVDVDGDGKDEIVDGAYTIDDNGVLLYLLDGIIHGDRFHVGDFDPDRPGLEGYGIQQNNATGLAWYYYDTKDGTLLQTQYLPNIGDYARGNVADMDPRHRGYEMWTFTDGIYNVQDGRITKVLPDSYPNFRIWWDGDELSELLDGLKFIKWDYNTNSEERLLTASTYGAVASWRNVPVFYGDMMGDWREEVIYEKSDRSALLIFTTTDPTDNRIYTLPQNPEYRLCMTTKGYYQSAQLDYYLGAGMTTPPLPAIQKASAIWKGTTSSEWNTTESNWIRNDIIGNYFENDTVFFGIAGSGNADIKLNEAVSPGLTYVLSPIDFAISGEGSISGSGRLIKSGYSTLEMNTIATYSGDTKVEQGAMFINKELTNSNVYVYGGAKLGGSGTITKNCFFEERAILAPGTNDSTGTLTFKESIDLKSGMICEFDLADDSTGVLKPSDKLRIEGDLTVENKVKFTMNAFNGEIKPGSYPLISYGGELTADLHEISIEGLFGKKYELVDSLKTIVLKIYGIRSAGTIVWSGTSPTWDLQNSESWLMNGASDFFASGDSVIFNSQGSANSSVFLEGNLPIGKMTISGDNTDYIFGGSGVIGGSGDVIKNDNGSAFLNLESNTYTGKTIINGGTLVAKKLDLAGMPSSIGANPSDSPSEFVINNGTFSYKSSASSYTDKGITLSGTTDKINVATAGTTLSVSGLISGTGQLVKTGIGTLYLLGNNNTYIGGTIIKEGTIQLNDPGSGQNVGTLGSGLITFEGGKLSMGDTRDYTDFNSDMHVAENESGTLLADQRCNFGGKLTGAGTLNIVLPGSIDRTIFRGDWSAFEGTVSMSGVSPTRLASSLGYAKMTFDLSSGMEMYFSKGTSSGDAVAQEVHIGGLNGEIGSSLRNENWYIGENNSDGVFQGKIFGNSLTKLGKGTLTITGSFDYLHPTAINNGILMLEQNAYISGTVIASEKGILAGFGTVSGTTRINAGGSIMPGRGGEVGTLNLSSDLELNSGSYTIMDVDKEAQTTDLLKVEGSIIFNGTLYMQKVNETYQEGDQYKLFDAKSYSGGFQLIIPTSPGEGLKWDTSDLILNGTLKVALATDVEILNSNHRIQVYPNPVNDLLTIQAEEQWNIPQVRILDIVGRIRFNGVPDENGIIDMSGIPAGIYVLEITTKKSMITHKLIKQ